VPRAPGSGAQGRYGAMRHGTIQIGLGEGAAGWLGGDAGGWGGSPRAGERE
jgi:hypothetical protein